MLSEHLDELYACALRFCAGRTADAEDLLQDAVYRAFQHFDDLRDSTAARAWLFTILTRTNLNRLRARMRRAETLATDLDEHAFEEALASWQPSDGPEQYADDALTRERVAAALDTLDDDLRAVVWLSDVEDFRQREVAEMLGIPEGTVASRLFRARRALRSALELDMPEIARRSKRE